MKWSLDFQEGQRSQQSRSRVRRLLSLCPRVSPHGALIPCPPASPESVIQTLYLVANTEHASALNVVSILFSFGSMGFSVGSVLVDIDLSIAHRRENKFHGYCPLTNAGEFSCIFSMTMANTGCIMAKTCALVATSTTFGPAVPAVVLLLEFGILNFDAYIRDEWFCESLVIGSRCLRAQLDSLYKSHYHTGDTTPDDTHVGSAMLKQFIVYAGTFVMRCIQFRVPLVCRGAHYCLLVASSMAINTLSAGSSAVSLDRSEI